MKRTAVAILAAALAACASPNAAARFVDAAPGQVCVRTELYFGTVDRDGCVVVSDAAWQAFLNGIVTPRFPQGLTVLSGNGQWHGATGLVHERSRVLILLHPPSAAANTAIEEIRSIYRQRFKQESVMRISAPAKADF